MDDFDSYDHYIYYCGQESLRGEKKNGAGLIVKKRVQNAALGYNLKTDELC